MLSNGAKEPPGNFDMVRAGMELSNVQSASRGPPPTFMSRDAALHKESSSIQASSSKQHTCPIASTPVAWVASPTFVNFAIGPLPAAPSFGHQAPTPSTSTDRSRHGIQESPPCNKDEMRSLRRRQSSRSLSGRGSSGQAKRRQVDRAWEARARSAAASLLQPPEQH